MEHAKHFIVPEFEIVNRDHFNKPTPGSKTSASFLPNYSNNWSGIASYDGSNYGGYTRIIGEWTVPNAENGSPTGPENQYSCSWIGLGGYVKNTQGLIQAGTEADLYIDPRTYVMTPTYYPWIEVVSYEAQVKKSSMSISPGDLMYCDVSYSSTSGGTANFYIEDISTNTAISCNTTGISGYYDGSTAEWIVERTEVGDQFPPLMDFQTEAFSDCYAFGSNGSEYSLGDLPYYSVPMQDDSATLLAEPNTPSTTSFTDYWYNYGEWDTI